MRIFPTGRIELSTSLSPGELVVALREALCQGPRPTGWKAAEVLAGGVSLERVLLTALPRADDRAVFITGQFSSMYELEGQVVPNAGGTVLRGELRLRPRWRWQIAAFLYGPAAVVAVLLVTLIASALMRIGDGHPHWTEAPGHALSRLLDVAIRPAAALIGMVFFPRLIAQTQLERERRVLERVMLGAISAAESAAAGKTVAPASHPS